MGNPHTHRNALPEFDLVFSILFSFWQANLVICRNSHYIPNREILFSEQDHFVMAINKLHCFSFLTPFLAPSLSLSLTSCVWQWNWSAFTFHVKCEAHSFYEPVKYIRVAIKFYRFFQRHIHFGCAPSFYVSTSYPKSIEMFVCVCVNGTLHKTVGLCLWWNRNKNLRKTFANIVQPQLSKCAKRAWIEARVAHSNALFKARLIWKSYAVKTKEPTHQKRILSTNQRRMTHWHFFSHSHILVASYLHSHVECQKRWKMFCLKTKPTPYIRPTPLPLTSIL